MPSEARLRRRSALLLSGRRLPRLAVTFGLLAAAQAAALAQPPAANTLIPASPAPAPAAPVYVIVDNVVLPLPPGVTAVAQGGRVLVPLRGIFERLGAKVKFDGPTHSVVAIKGETNVFLQMGNTTAVLNGAPRKLTTPPQMIGTTTMVPLRFVSEALGAKVKWNPVTRTVRIFTTEALAADPTIANTPPALVSRDPAGGAAGGAPTTPPITPPAAPVDTPVSGTLVTLDAGATPSVTVHVDMPAPGVDLPIGVTADARVLQKRGDDPATVTTLASLRPGDQITVRRNAAGLATDIEADYLEAKGTIKTVAPGDNGVTHVTFADDTTSDLAATAPVMLGGNPATLADLKPLMTLTVRENPTTKQGIGVTAMLQEVKITGLTVTGADKTLTAADTVNVTLVGTPGGKATITAAGLPTATDLTLTETPATPGTYTGSFPIPPGYTIDKATITGALTIDPAAAPAFASPTTLTVDSQPPTITNIQPAEESTVTDRRPDISGDLDDKGTGLDPASFHFVLNDADITSQIKLTKTHFLMHPTADLPPGTNKVTVTVKDLAGNVAQQDLIFSIIPAVSPLKVVTITIPDGVDALQASDILHVRAEATPGGTAKYMIGPNNLISAPMTEEKPGIYTGTYTVRQGDSLTGATVTVAYTPPTGGDPITMAALQKVTLSAGPPVAPIIDQPLEGASTGSYVTINGHATPNSTVRLTIAYAGKVIVLKKSGNLTSLDLPVGRDGTWTTDLLTLDTGNAGSVSFTATAVTVLKDGEISAPSMVKFKK